MLTIVPTPIGNLGDISERAKSTLSSVEVVLCEDTRHTQKLLHSFGITIPKLISLHGHNEISKVPSIISRLKEGVHMALVSDAGTPLISDPGRYLIEAVHNNGISLTVLPGPSAMVTALSAAGLAAPYQFLGFPPRKSGQLTRFIEDLSLYPGSTVLYEAGNRCEKLTRLLKQLLPDRELCMCRELTKKFEEIKREKLSNWVPENVRGEVVFVVGPGKPIIEDYNDVQGIRDISKKLASIWQISASDAYSKLLSIKPVKDDEP